TVWGPNCVKPPEDSDEMLSLTQPPAESWLPNAPVCRYSRNWVVPPTAITPGAWEGRPIVPLGPASPLLASTVTPACTAAAAASRGGASASDTGSLPGSG